MAKLTSFEEVFSSKSGSLRSSAVFRFSDDFKGKISFLSTQPASVDLELLGRNWSISHNVATKNTVLKKAYKSVGNSKINITQKIPQGKIYLIPTPCIKISKVGVLGPSNVAYLQHDALARQSSAGICVYGGEDKRLKLKLTGDSENGYNGTIRSKVYKGGMLHSVSASGTPTAPTVSIKSRLGEDAKTKLSYSMKSGLLSLIAIHKTLIDGKNRMTTKATISTSLHGRFAAPQIQLGVKLEV